MAERFYGLDRGETKNDVTEGASSTSTLDVEVRIDLASNVTQSEVVFLIEEIKNFILENTRRTVG